MQMNLIKTNVFVSLTPYFLFFLFKGYIYLFIEKG